MPTDSLHTPDEPIGKSMPFLDHLTELRKLLIVSVIALAAGTAVAFALYDHIIDILYTPLTVLSERDDGNLLYINTIFEGFLTRFKISLLSGAVLSFPVHLFNIMRFTFPGLRAREKRVIIISLSVSFVFIVVSFFYSYYKIIPVSVSFLTGKGFIPERTGLLLGFSGNIFYILQFMLAALVVFQIPILLEILMVLNVLSRKVLWRIGRYVILATFVLAAVITPPDIVTQLSIALPLVVLYYLALLIAKIFRFGSE